MNYLVTGHEGFIGKAIFKRLEKETLSMDMVMGYDILPNSSSKILNEYLYYIRPDVIFHAGAFTNTQSKDFNKMMYLNIEMTNAIVEYCKNMGADLIFSSSAACYGEKNMPNNLYGWSKYAGEKLVQTLGGVSLRYFNVYGYDESHKGDTASIAYQAHIINKSDDGIMLLFPKRPKRDFVYIEDVVDANIFAWKNYSSLQGDVYDVGTGDARFFEDILNFMQIPFDYYHDSVIPENYQYYTCANPTKFMQGWQPKYTLEQGLSEYVKILSSC